MTQRASLQALETRENLILSQARALHSARCDQATHARQQLEAAHQQEEEGVELAGRSEIESRPEFQYVLNFEGA